VLVHFHLKDHILIGKKKQKDVQFFTEVIESSLNLDGGRRSAYDPDEVSIQDECSSIEQSLDCVVCSSWMRSNARGRCERSSIWLLESFARRWKKWPLTTTSSWKSTWSSANSASMAPGNTSGLNKQIEMVYVFLCFQSFLILVYKVRYFYIHLSNL